MKGGRVVRIGLQGQFGATLHFFEPQTLKGYLPQPDMGNGQVGIDSQGGMATGGARSAEIRTAVATLCRGRAAANSGDSPAK